MTTKEFLEPHRNPEVGPNELRTYCSRNNCFPKEEELQATFRCRGLLRVGKEKDLAEFKKHFFMGMERFDQSKSRQRGERKRASHGGGGNDSDDNSTSTCESGIGGFVKTYQKSHSSDQFDHRGGGERLFRDGGGVRMGRGGTDDRFCFVDQSPSFTAGEFQGSSTHFNIG